VEPDGSLPHSQQPALVPVLNQIKPVHTLPYCFLNIHFNIILQTAPLSSKWSFSSGFPTKPCMHLSSLHTCYMSRPSHPALFESDDPNNTWWAVQIMKLLIMLFAPVSYYFLLIRAQYLPQHTTLYYTQTLSAYVLLITWEPYKKQANLFVLILIHIFLVSKWEDRTFWNEWQQVLLLNINWQLQVFLIALHWIWWFKLWTFLFPLHLAYIITTAACFQNYVPWLSLLLTYIQGVSRL
jgi:hypothetical protein